MDPTVVLKLVREQRRQINDTYNTQQKFSSPSLSPNSISPNTMFQPPQPPQFNRNRYPYPMDPNYKPKTDINNNYTQKVMFQKQQELDMYMMNRQQHQQQQINSSQKADNNYYHQIATNMADSLSRSASVKSDSGIGSNSPSSDCSDYNSNNSYMLNQQKNYKIPQPNQQASQMSPFQMVKKRKNSYEDTNMYANKIDAEKMYQNYSKNMNESMNAFNPNNSHKIPLHNSYYANQQICDKECCAHLKQMNIQKPLIMPMHNMKPHASNVKSNYCDCKECNEMMHKKNYPVSMQQTMNSQSSLPPGYCDCPSCNLALANEKKGIKNNLHGIVAPKPMIPNPIPPIPTNRFVISQNSSFSPITPSQKYMDNKKNYPHYDHQQTLQQHSKCSCPECLKNYKPGDRMQQNNSGLIKIAKPTTPTATQQTPNHFTPKQNKIPQQQTGLTLPVVLASDLANYENYQNIIKQKNLFYNNNGVNQNNNEQPILKRPKLDDEQTFLKSTNSQQILANPSQQQQQQQQQMYNYKKNRIIHEKPNEQENSSSVICLNNNDEIELGEVVSVDKLNPEHFKKNESTNNSNNTNGNVINRDSESPVIISKKMMPIILKRTNDWLEKSVELAVNLSNKTGVSLDKIFSILLKSWSKVLLVYMIENNLEFYVTKDYANECNDSCPKESDASNLIDVINRGHTDLTIETSGYDLLREIVLLKNCENDPQLCGYLSDANTKLHDLFLNGQEVGYDKLQTFLPNIHMMKTNVIEGLFYRNSSVQDILNKKLNDLLKKCSDNQEKSASNQVE